MRSRRRWKRWQLSQPFHPEIPIGDQCYVYLGQNAPKTIGCPHSTTKLVNGVALPWCNFLNRGSVPAASGMLSDLERERLQQAWGTSRLTRKQAEAAVVDGIYNSIEEAMAERSFETPPLFDLFLFWDGCKECSINSDNVLERRYYSRYPKKPRNPYPYHIVQLAYYAPDEPTRLIPVWVRYPKDGTATQKARFWVRQLHRLRIALKSNLNHEPKDLFLPTHPEHTVGLHDSFASQMTKLRTIQTFLR